MIAFLVLNFKKDFTRVPVVKKHLWKILCQTSVFIAYEHFFCVRLSEGKNFPKEKKTADLFFNIKEHQWEICE